MSSPKISYVLSVDGKKSATGLLRQAIPARPFAWRKPESELQPKATLPPLAAMRLHPLSLPPLILPVLSYIFRNAYNETPHPRRNGLVFLAFFLLLLRRVRHLERHVRVKKAHSRRLSGGFRRADGFVGTVDRVRGSLLRPRRPRRRPSRQTVEHGAGCGTRKRKVCCGRTLS